MNKIKNYFARFTSKHIPHDNDEDSDDDPSRLLPDSTQPKRSYSLRYKTQGSVKSVPIDAELVEYLRDTISDFPSSYTSFSYLNVEAISDDDVVKFVSYEPVSSDVQANLQDGYACSYATLRAGLHAFEGAFIVSLDNSWFLDRLYINAYYIPFDILNKAISLSTVR